MNMKITKKSKSLRDMLLEDTKEEGTLFEHVSKEFKPLSHYLKKPIGIKVVTKSDKIQTEDEVVTECKKWLKLHGWIAKTLYTGGIPTGNGRYAQNPAKGIPDCLAFHPKDKRVVWLEFKKSKGGIVSQEQQGWHILLKNTGQKIYIINSVKLLEEVLTNETK